MSECKAIKAKMLSFESEGDTQQADVKKHVSECDSCREYFAQLRLIIFSLVRKENGPHIAGDMLTRYSLFLSAPQEPDYDGRELTEKEVQEIKAHLTKCDGCNGEVQERMREFREIETYLDNTALAEIDSSAPSKQQFGSLLQRLSKTVASMRERFEGLLYVPLPRLAPIAFGAAAVLVLVILSVPFLLRSDNPYAALASLEGERFTSITRSAGVTSLNEGLEAFHQKRFQAAIVAFERFITQKSNDPNLFYAHYLAGASYLMAAPQEVLGQLVGFEHESIDNAVRHLQAAAHLTDSSGLKEDCQWYTAKAHLMKEEAPQARQILEQLISQRGRRFRDAKNLIAEIDLVAHEQ